MTAVVCLYVFVFLEEPVTCALGRAGKYPHLSYFVSKTPDVQVVKKETARKN